MSFRYHSVSLNHVSHVRVRTCGCIRIESRRLNPHPSYPLYTSRLLKVNGRKTITVRGMRISPCSVCCLREFEQVVLVVYSYSDP